MESYDSLVKALRSDAASQYTRDAAAAIEELQAAWIKSETDATNLTGRLAQAEADIERLSSEIDKRIATEIELSNQVDALQAEVKRLKECNDELREAQTYIDHYGDKWMTSAKDVPTSAYNHGYMDGKNEAEQAGEPKRGEMVKVVRCKDCVYYHKAHVKLDDGTELDYDSDVVKEYQQKRKESGDPFWEMVCADLGMNVGGRCERDNNQGYAEDKAVFRSETDFCSKARAKMEVQE